MVDKIWLYWGLLLMFILETRTNQKLKEALNSCIEINTIFYFLLLLFFKFLLMIIWFAWNLKAKWNLNDNTSTSIMTFCQCLKGIHQSKPHLSASKIMMLMGHSMWYSHLKKRFSIWLLKVNVCIFVLFLTHHIL